MDPDEIQFILVLYLIYLSDCFVLPRSSALILYSRFRGFKCRVKSTFGAPVFAERFWIWRPLFPPVGGSHVLEYFRCSFGAQGLSSASPFSEPAAGAERARYISYDDIEAVEVRDHALWINGEKWFSGSRKMYGLKRDLDAVVGSADRAAAIGKMLDVSFAEGSKAGEALKALQQQTEWLNFFTSLYAIILLIFVPYGIFHLPVRLQIWGVAVPFVLLHLICGGVYLWTHKRLLAEEKGHRWEHFFKMFLCPPMLVRACDVIEDRVGLGGDAAVVLMSCASEKVWRPELTRLWRRLIPCSHERFPAETASAVREFGEMYRARLAEELEHKGIEAAALEIDASSVAKGQMFCPRCEAQFRGSMRECNDCGGVVLVAGEGE